MSQENYATQFYRATQFLLVSLHRRHRPRRRRPPAQMPSSDASSVYFVTIASGLALCIREMLEAKDSEASLRGIERMLAKCTDEAGKELPLVRRAAIEGRCGGELVKLGKKVLDSAKAASAMQTLLRLLIRPPPRGVTDVADPLRRALIEGGFGQHCVETLAKYADQGAVAEIAALNLQYLFNAPASWDFLQPTISSGAVAALAGCLVKSGTHEGATAGCLETLAFMAHVDVAKRKGEWQVAGRLNDLDAWNTITNKSLGNHGRSGRVAAAAMLLLHKCASSPKAGNALRGMSAAGLVSTALRFARRSVAGPGGARPESPERERGRSSSPGPGETLNATLTATARAPEKSHPQGAMGPAQPKGPAGPPPMRSYAQHAWAFAGELAAKSPETFVAGDPDAAVRLLLAPLLAPLPNQLPHARAALGIVSSLVRNSPDFLAQFVATGGCATLARLVDTLREPEAALCLAGAEVLRGLSEVPAVLPAVVDAGGFDVLLNAYFRAWEVAPQHMAMPSFPPNAKADAANKRLAALRDMALGVVRVARADDERRELLATVVANALANGLGGMAARHVSAAACLVRWSVGCTPPAEHFPEDLHADEEALADCKLYVQAGAQRSALAALRTFALDDNVLGAVLGALRVLLLVEYVPPEVPKVAAVAPRPGDPPPPPPEAPGAKVIGAVLDVLKTGLKRDQAPDNAVWTQLFTLLEQTVQASAANTVCFLRVPGLLGVLARVLEWGLRVSSADDYRAWRVEARPPKPDEEVAKKHGEEAKAAALAEGADAAAAAAAMQAAIDRFMAPTELPEETSQWLMGRVVRLFNFACGEGGANSNTVAQLRAASLHRKVAEFVWPWVLSLAADGLEPAEIDAGATEKFLKACWLVTKDGPYQEWEAGASREDIALVSKRFPSWRVDESLLLENGNGWKTEPVVLKKSKSMAAMLAK